MTHRIPIDCKHVTHRRWFKIKRSALRLKRSIGRLLHLIAKEPLTDAGILWVSYFAGDPCIRRLLAWLLRDDIVVDTVSTWTLDALVSAGGETVETTLKVTIEDDPPEPDVGHFDHGMAIGPIFLETNAAVLLMLISLECGEQFAVGVNERLVPVQFDLTELRRNAGGALIKPGPLDAEIAAYIAEVQLTLMEHTCLI